MLSAEGTARAKVLRQEVFSALQRVRVAIAFHTQGGEGSVMGGNFPDLLGGRMAQSRCSEHNVLAFNPSSGLCGCFRPLSGRLPALSISQEQPRKYPAWATAQDGVS